MSFSVHDQAFSAAGRDITTVNFRAANGNATPISGDATVIEFDLARRRGINRPSENCELGYHEACRSCRCTCHQEVTAA